jgi:CO/xanthine dehydrogenase FAD-binding subunit
MRVTRRAHEYRPVEHRAALARHAQRIKRFQQLTLAVGIVERFGWRNTDVLRQARDGSVTVAAGSVAAHLTICTACASVA